MKAALAGALSGFLAANTLFGQVRGRVVTPDGQPVADALVELWSPGARIAAQGTNRQGRFYFAARGDATALLVRRIGFQAARLTLGSSDTIVVALRPRPVVLSSVEAIASQPMCVSRDDPAAVSLWRATATRYAVVQRDPKLRGAPAEMRESPQALVLRRRVPAESLGAVDTASATTIYIAGASLGGEFQRRERFYAWPANDLYGLFGDWSYPWLWSVSAWHFADTSFINRNRLEFTEPDENGSTSIAFCSRHGNWPYIRGRLMVSADSTLLKAQWEFVAPERPEKAGGEVLFAPPAPDSSAPLLPAAGMFWRALVRGYLQEWMEYRRWYACEGGGQRCSMGRRLGP